MRRSNYSKQMKFNKNTKHSNLIEGLVKLRDEKNNKLKERFR